MAVIVSVGYAYDTETGGPGRFHVVRGIADENGILGRQGKMPRGVNQRLMVIFWWV